MSQYVVKDRDEVLSDFLMDYIAQVDDGITAKEVKQIMRSIQEFEEKNQLQFVNFFGSQFLIFKTINT